MSRHPRPGRPTASPGRASKHPVVDAFFDDLFGEALAPRRPLPKPEPEPEPEAAPPALVQAPVKVREKAAKTAKVAKAAKPKEAPPPKLPAEKPRKLARAPAEAPAAAQITDPERLLFASVPAAPVRTARAPEPAPETPPPSTVIPQVALRENETVARASAGGVVIRRARA